MIGTDLPILVTSLLVDVLTAKIAILSLHEVLNRMKFEVSMTKTDSVYQTLKISMKYLNMLRDIEIVQGIPGSISRWDLL